MPSANQIHIHYQDLSFMPVSFSQFLAISLTQNSDKRQTKGTTTLLIIKVQYQLAIQLITLNSNAKRLITGYLL